MSKSGKLNYDFGIAENIKESNENGAITQVVVQVTNQRIAFL